MFPFLECWLRLRSYASPALDRLAKASVYNSFRLIKPWLQQPSATRGGSGSSLAHAPRANVPLHFKFPLQRQLLPHSNLLALRARTESHLTVGGSPVDVSLPTGFISRPRRPAHRRAATQALRPNPLDAPHNWGAVAPVFPDFFIAASQQSSHTNKEQMCLRIRNHESYRRRNS